MENIVVWGVDWLPPVAQGLVRDLRVRWALEEAELPYECRVTSAADRNSAAYRTKHPFGKVPVLESSDDVMFESGAIVYHIAQYCEALMPRGLCTETLTWMFAALDTVEPPLWNLLEIDLLHAGEEWAKLRRPAAVDEVKARLAALARRLDDRDFLLGRFTAADILMTTVLRFIRHTDIVTGFPRVDAYVKRCEARPTFQEALRKQMADYAQNAPVAA